MRIRALEASYIFKINNIFETIYQFIKILYSNDNIVDITFY